MQRELTHFYPTKIRREEPWKPLSFITQDKDGNFYLGLDNIRLPASYIECSVKEQSLTVIRTPVYINEGEQLMLTPIRNVWLIPPEGSPHRPGKIRVQSGPSTAGDFKNRMPVDEWHLRL